MSAEILQLSSWVKVPNFLTNSRFPFIPNKDDIKNIKLGVNQAVTIEDTVSLATSVKKQTTPVPSLFPFDKFSSYQKHLRIAAYVLQLLPKHAGYRNPDGSITDLIMELRYGSDSVARSAVLRTSTGSLVRPLVKLVPVFPTSSSGPEDVTQ